jgi:tetratricopeptide (TPR) repeat protein
MRLLRWPDALATGQRLWALRERLENSGLRAATEGQYALVLVALGRQREAAEVLAAITRADANKPDGLDRFGLWARADLAWQQGRSEQAVAAAQQALAVWPPPSSLDADQRAAVALLLQRASSAGGHPLQADIGAPDATAAEPMAAVYALVAQAEWTAAQGEDANAERVFKEAAATAEAQGVPDTIVLAADAYVRWLLAHGRTAEAVARAGRVGVWAEQDFDSALLQVAVYHASGESEAWAHALHLAQGLAGERSIPAALLAPPAAASSP